jgi:hypothetical protein
MDNSEPQDRIIPLINALAANAFALPAGDRIAFVNSQIDAMTRTYRRAYAADGAMLGLALDFAEKMREWGCGSPG